MSEEQQAIIEDAKEAGFKVKQGFIYCPDYIKYEPDMTELLTEFAQLQAARNQSNNETLGWYLITGQGNSFKFGANNPHPDVIWNGQPAWKPAYTSPQQSNQSNNVPVASPELLQDLDDYLVYMARAVRDTATAPKARIFNEQRYKRLSDLREALASPQQSNALEMAAKAIDDLASSGENKDDWTITRDLAFYRAAEAVRALIPQPVAMAKAE